MRIILFIFLALCCRASSGNAQNLSNCNQGQKLAENTWEKWGAWQPDISLVPFKNEINRLKQHWNWIASNGIGTIGPRRLDINGSTEQGTILGQTKSTFVTNPSFNNRVVVTINKVDGRAETGVAICTHTRDGVTNTVATYIFPNNNNGQTKTFTINSAKGKIISIAMKNNSVTNRFQYNISAD
jgi:hypothetical protein